MERKKITFYDPDEIANIKAQLAEYIELGTPDELAKALAASKESYYPILVDKYMDMRKRFISVKTENAKLKQIIESLNIKIEEKDKEYREKNRNGIKVQVISNPQIDRTAEQLVQEATALRHELDYANHTIDQLEAKLKQREQVAAKRKEYIQFLKAWYAKAEKSHNEYCEYLSDLCRQETRCVVRYESLIQMLRRKLISEEEFFTACERASKVERNDFAEFKEE